MILRTSWEVNQNGLGCIASERLSFTRLGKAFRGKPRSNESGNPTFRDCRGARGNVTCQLLHGARASALSRLAPANFQPESLRGDYNKYKSSSVRPSARQPLA